MLESAISGWSSNMMALAIMVFKPKTIRLPTIQGELERAIGTVCREEVG